MWNIEVELDDMCVSTIKDILETPEDIISRGEMWKVKRSVVIPPKPIKHQVKCGGKRCLHPDIVKGFNDIGFPIYKISSSTIHCLITKKEQNA